MNLIIDLDNTLYDYDKADSIAQGQLFKEIAILSGVSLQKIKESYKLARIYTHTNLSFSTSCHNRLLYIQKTLELLNLNPLLHTLNLHNIYWEVFLDSMEAFSGVKELLEKYQNKICILSDFNAQAQYQKLHRLNLQNFIGHIVTSEEVGVEKPHRLMFATAITKLNASKEQVIMIGDSFEKDILGAKLFGIKSIYLNRNLESCNLDSSESKQIREVREFKQILELV